AHQLLVGTESVQRRGIEMIYAEIQCAQQQGGGSGRSRRAAVAVAQAHAAEPDGGHRRRAEPTPRRRPRHQPLRPVSSRAANLGRRNGKIGELSYLMRSAYFQCRIRTRAVRAWV